MVRDRWIVLHDGSSRSLGRGRREHRPRVHHVAPGRGGGPHARRMIPVRQG
ncbi:hypothetical protein NSERUTF1_3075 [Nocardia seriolae]|nr:hypothetical protein NSERUTF1_3075 [Nocardia seriolae]